LNPLAGINGQLVIDDAYNANPDSVAAAVDVLVTAPGRKILVLGDLAELGEASLTLHAGLGSMASEKGVDVLYTCGGDSHAASDHFDGKACHYETREQLISALQQETGGNDYILVKGSRSSGMDRVVAALCCSNGSTDGGESC
jgi:UDP-N-acetylmuramoyl-tripeptide--D-alanyl-D-alanine ligase